MWLSFLYCVCGVCGEGCVKGSLRWIGPGWGHGPQGASGEVIGHAQPGVNNNKSEYEKILGQEEFFRLISNRV